MTPAPRGALAVVVKGWPRLSETFIAQELVALEAMGHRLEIWSLRRPTDTKRHPLHDALRAPVHYLPEYLHDEPVRVLRAVVSAVQRRGFWRGLWLWLRDLRRDPSRNRVRRFGQACVLARELPADCPALYAHFMHTPASVTRYAAVMRGLPWAFSAHAKDIWTSPDWEKREKLHPASSGAVFGATCTAYGAAHLRDLADVPDRVNLIYHGLDLSRFPDPPPTRPARDGSGDAVRLLSVGRLVEKKGYDRLLQALALLPPGLSWRLVHIGGGELKKALAVQAEALGIADRIDWRGARNQPEVIAAMRDADLFVLPSRIASDGDRDGLPNVLMEAASQGLAILSTPVAAIPEFITDGVEGVLSSDDPATLALALGRVMRDPDARAAMAAAARVRLVRDFGMQRGISRLDKLICGLTGRA
jgi:glycosyltransferase involved in cell wall biosynthesis